jgi:hypothetical protein
MAKAQTQTGKRAIRAKFTDALRALDDENPPDYFDPNQPRDGIKPGAWPGAPFASLPPACPVLVVGFDVDQKLWLKNARGYLMAIERFDANTLTAAFSPQTDYLLWAWPAFGAKKITNSDGGTEEIKVVKRLEVQQAAMCLQTEAGRKRVFDPHTMHRGRGGWVDKQDGFIWHSGDWLWRSERGKLISARPDEYDGFLYTRGKPTIEPWHEPVATDESPAKRILDDLATWNWQRPYLDPVLVLGWIASSLMGGALKARPIVFTTGGHGVGKSTLHELITNTLQGVVNTAVDTTAAGIYQKAKHDALPFLVDELESKAGSSKNQSVIELARVAYTGGDISRGGADHEGTTFKMNSSFMFSAINPPPMGAQDKSRMAVLNLGRLEANDGVRKMVANLEEDGRMILRQVLDGWADYKARLLPDYWKTLHDQKLDSRAIDTFGTLLAAAEMLVGPEALEAIGLPVTDQAQLGEIIRHATQAEREENLDNWHKCLNQLLDSTIDQWRDGIKPTVGGVCDEAMRGALDITFARDRLGLVNCGLMPAEHLPDATGPLLAVPKTGPALMRIFDGTEFHKEVHFTALKQAPRQIVIADRGNKQKVKIAGVPKHCLLIDLAAFQRYAAPADSAGQG